MICYSLICSENHRFESWFASAEAYNNLKKAGHLSCSVCGSENVEKAVMAPNVSMASKKRAAKEQPLTGSKSPTEKAIKELKKHIEKNSENVGNNFAMIARQIHQGEEPERNIHGSTSFSEAKELSEEGIPVIPLPWLDRKTN